MNPIILTVTVLLPVLGGALIPLLPFRSRRQMLIYIETVVLINTALVLTALLNRPADGIVLFHLNGRLSISFSAGRSWNGLCGDRVAAVAACDLIRI